MSKGQDSKRNTKKEASKTPKEKKRKEIKESGQSLISFFKVSKSKQLGSFG
jgi:hypothetical protein